ncbi:hypothetical protein [Paenibacillus sp. JGP012]|uniref:hypothetical protein n=1 Tax=Paenibacillus sp. JGP012 TaxID=2735914 RepID=UPI0016197A74|nr:hypothetical protein [Paenibacillus sp. JGP012]
MPLHRVDGVRASLFLPVQDAKDVQDAMIEKIDNAMIEKIDNAIIEKIDNAIIEKIDTRSSEINE